MGVVRGLGALAAACVLLAAGGGPALAGTPADLGLQVKPGGQDKQVGAQAENPRRDPAQIQQSVKFVSGVLPNGLRYVVARNGAPAHQVSIRLAIDAGRFDEEDNERGAAHFVEHMAFAGARNLAGDALARAFEARGVEFARDLNADTDLYQTTYKLDLPTADPASLNLAFQWLRDVADGLAFDDAVVSRERSVLQAERARRMTPEQEASEALLDMQGPGLRVADRSKLDPADGLAALTPAALRVFHDRWYRPERAVVVVVGDMPVDQMLQRVEAAFGAWKAAGAPPARKPPEAPPARGQETFVRAETTLVPIAEACRMSAVADLRVTDVGALRRRMSETLWIDILNRRLDRAANAPKPAFLKAGAAAPSEWRGLARTCLYLAPLNGDWRGGLAAAQAEFRRLEAAGPTAAEIKVSEERLLNNYQNDSDIDAPSPDLARRLAERALRGEPFPDQAEAKRAFDLALAGVAPAQIKAAIDRDWSGSGPMLALVAANPPSPEALRAAWSQGESAPLLGAYAAPPSASWSYTRFGETGRVIERRPIPEGDFVRLRFANGVILNFKATAFPEDKVEVRVRFGAGRREIANGKYFSAMVASKLFVTEGLGRMDITAVHDALQDRSWSVDLSITDTAFVLSGKTTPDSLQVQLQLLAAYMTDPAFRSLDARIPTAIEAIYRALDSNPGFAMRQALDQAFSPGGPNNLPPDRRALKLDNADFEALLRPPLRDAPIEVTIVGRVEEAQVIALMSATFGALPPRAAGDRARADTWFRRIQQTPIGPIRVAVGGPDKAMAEDAWPLFVAGPDNRAEQLRMRVVARILNDALFHRVRIGLGKTYTPTVGVDLPERGDQGYIAAVLDASPSDVAVVQAEIGRAAAALARGEIDQSDLEAARAPLVAQLDQAATTERWWADLLDGSARDPGDVAYGLQARTMLADMTLDEVKAAAARWLSRPPVEVTAVPAASGPR